jgi:hypothetical protein
MSAKDIRDFREQQAAGETEKPKPKPPRRRESASEGLLRIAAAWEIVSHRGNLYAIRDGQHPISIESLVAKVSRMWTKQSARTAPRDVVKAVTDHLNDPDAPERDLSEELERMREEMEERAARMRAEIAAEHERRREQEIEEATEAAGSLLDEENVTEKLEEALVGRVAGKSALRSVRLLYLVGTSRLLDQKRVGSEILKGQSAIGKTFLAEEVFAFFPTDSIYKANSMSEKAIFYEPDGFLTGKILYLGEATGIEAVEFVVSIVRQLLSDGEAIHRVVIEGETMEMKVEGPVASVLTTTTAKLDPEMETRMISDWVDDSPQQTREVMRAVAAVEDGTVPEPDLGPWRALQRLLELNGPYRAVVPFASKLAELLPNEAVRMRRDITLLILLCKANAVLHERHRERDELDRIIVTFDDYAVVRAVLANLFEEAAESVVPATVREAVWMLPAKGEPGISYRELGEKLGVHKNTARTRIERAIASGWALNEAEGRKGKAAQLVRGEAMPDDQPVLPEVAALREHLESGCPPAQSPETRLNQAENEWANAVAHPLPTSAQAAHRERVGKDRAEPIAHPFSPNHAENGASGQLGNADRPAPSAVGGEDDDEAVARAMR